MLFVRYRKISLIVYWQEKIRWPYYPQVVVSHCVTRYLHW